MSQSATPATQNDMTSYLETFEKERFCGFPHRHGEATGKAETRDKTRGCRKISISYETSSNFHSLKHAARTCFPASPIDTARPQGNQRLETRHVGAPKRAFRARLPPIFTLCSFKIDVFLRVFLATQNDMTSYLETFEKERFCGFPHRHGEATGKAETRDKTRGCRKISISYETSSNFHSLKHAARTCFPASPIDTARPQGNQRLETRHVGAPKRAFRARLPPIFTLCSFKIDVFLRVFLRT